VADRYVFADEAGDFGFNRKPRASRYFIVTTVTLNDCRVGDALMQLRRELTWRNRNLERPFHAAKDPPDVRGEVFRLIMRYPLRVDATALEKRKTKPKYHSDTEMYKLAWYLHWKEITRRIATSQDRLFVCAASIGTKKTRAVFEAELRSVVRQVTRAKYRVGFWPSETDPCLWLADYCCWAVQRKYETGDGGPLAQIESKVTTNFDAFAQGGKTYY